jgi:hypothetical protein
VVQSETEKNIGEFVRRSDFVLQLVIVFGIIESIEWEYAYISGAHCHMYNGVLPASIVSYHRSVKQTIGSGAIS